MTSPYFTYYYSKAFDTVYRKNVFETKVKIGETIGESFNTYTGIMEGDFLIAILSHQTN